MTRKLVSLLGFMFIISCFFWNTAEAATIEAEPNDTLGTATEIQVLKDTKGKFADNEDIDFYRIYLPYKGSFTLYSYLGNSKYDNGYYSNSYKIILYDKNGNLIKKSSYNYNYDYDSYEYKEYQKIKADLEKGTYYIAFEVTDNYDDLSGQSYILYQDAKFEPDFSIDSFTANVASPQLENKTISFKASSKKAGLHYQFSVGNKVEQKFGSSANFKWTPSKAGTYTVKVEARDPEYPYVVTAKSLTYKITAYKPDFKIMSLSPSSSKVIIQNKKVTLKTNTDKSNLQYQYSIGGKIVQKFSSKSTYNWKPTKAGKHNIKVEVRRAKYPNAIVSKQSTYQVHNGNVKVTSMKANLSSPRPINKTIKWTAKANGVDLQYKFSLYSNKKWKTVQNYSSKNQVNWKPTKAGKYKFKVEVRSRASGKQTSKTVNYTVFKPSDFSITSFKVNKKSPQTTGTYLTYTAKAKGSYLEYRFRVNNGYGWYTAQNYSSKKTYSTYAYSSGTLKVAVDIRQKGTTKKKTKVVTLKIKEKPNFYMNSNYNMNYNYGYLKVTNYGYENLKVNKIELINGDKTIHTYSPKDWITIGRSTETFHYYPKKKITKYSYYTYWKVTYTYDGIKHTVYLYRN